MPVWVLRSLLGLALIALALSAASTASARITPTSAGFAATQAGTLTIRTPLMTVTCSSSTLSGTTPSSDTATSLTIAAVSFSGCSSPLGAVTITSSTAWSLGLPTLTSSPGSGAATLAIPALTAVVGGGACSFSGSGTLSATWTDGGSVVDQSSSPASQLAIAAGTLTLSGTCPGVTTGTVTGTWNVADTSSPVQLWAGVGSYVAAPNPFEFPETRAGSDTTRAIRVDNNTNNDVTITRANVVGDRVFSVDVGAGFVVDANSSVPVDVKFAPTAAGDFRAKIELLDAGGNVKFTIEVKGRAR